MPGSDDLVLSAAITYDFRRRRADESAAAYRTALIAHVQARDLSAAHELRVGRRQAEWTAADIEAFIQHSTTLPGPASEFAPGLHTYLTWDDAGPYAVTDDELLKQARFTLTAVASGRRDNPTRELPVTASVLLTTGHVLNAAVNPSARLAYLKAVARTQPVFGFFLVFDGWLHQASLEPGKQTATKRDAFFAHVGSRTGLRCTMVRPYTVRDGQAIFDAPPPADITQRDLRTGNDPYADVFAMPMGTRVQ